MQSNVKAGSMVHGRICDGENIINKTFFGEDFKKIELKVTQKTFSKW